jgi:Uma2 family endonuclease
MAITERALTLEELLQLPEVDEKPYLELWDGVVRQKVSPQNRHGVLQGQLVEGLNRVARPKQLGLASTETRFKVNGGTAVPDVSYYRRERIPLLPNGQVRDDLLGPPDLAVEIVSPGQSVSELVRKCVWYADNGVRITLLVVPADEIVFDFRPGAPLRVLQGTDRIDVDDVLPGFELTAAGLFDLLVPPWARPAETREE